MNGDTWTCGITSCLFEIVCADGSIPLCPGTSVTGELLLFIGNYAMTFGETFHSVIKPVYLPIGRFHHYLERLREPVH